MPRYISPQGAKRLQAELASLRAERPAVVQDVAAAAAQGDRSENAEYIYGKKKLREIDRKIEHLLRTLDSIEVVSARPKGETKIFFGAWVELQDEEGGCAIYRILGSDEVDLEQRAISYLSPLGRALLGRTIGDRIRWNRPNGSVEWRVIRVEYERE